MSVTTRRRFAVVALAAGLAMSAAACSAEDDDGGTGSEGQTTVVLQWFGSPGFDQAVKDFMAKNPNIKVDSQNMGQLADFRPKLTQWLATGKGAGDVVMLEEG